jgi:uncharacterized membrane protein YdjX (TVP38/TMEM64 family)
MRTLVRLLLLLALVLLVPVLPFLLCGPALEAWMSDWLHHWATPGRTAGLVIGLLATDILLPVPASLVSTLGGARLGWAAGTLASWTGMTCGACLGFALARWGGRPLVERWVSAQDQQQLAELSHRVGPALLVVTRAVPILAEAAVLLLGLQGLAWSRFLPPIVCSNLGIALAYSAFGRLAAAEHWLPLALGISLALPLLLVTLTRRWLRSAARDD